VDAFEVAICDLGFIAFRPTPLDQEFDEVSLRKIADLRIFADLSLETIDIGIGMLRQGHHQPICDPKDGRPESANLLNSGPAQLVTHTKSNFGLREGESSHRRRHRLDARFRFSYPLAW